MSSTALPDISVVMPVYNAKPYLIEALESLFSQTFSQFELICIDDGSTDGSYEYLEDIASREARLKIVRQGNRGAAAARNRGLSLARAPYIMFLDADDVFSQDLLQKLYTRIVGDDAELVACTYRAFKEDAHDASAPVPLGIATDVNPITRIDAGTRLFYLFPEVPWNKLIRKEFLLRNNLTFQSLPNSNDILFGQLVVACAARISLVDEPLVLYRIGGGGSIQDKRLRHPFCFMEALDALWVECDKRSLVQGEALVSLKSRLLDSFFCGFESLAGDLSLLRECYGRFAGELASKWGLADEEISYFKGSTNAKFMYWCLRHSTEERFLRAFQSHGNWRGASKRRKIMRDMRLVQAVAMSCIRR